MNADQYRHNRMKTIDITDPQLIESIIGKCAHCTVGIIDTAGNPYVIPMNFAYEAGKVYLHSGAEGSKIEMLSRNPRVCINFCEGHELVYMHQQVACSYSMKSRSVICRGAVQFVDDLKEKERILTLLMRHYTANECRFSAPALRNVMVWQVDVEEMTCRSFGLRPSEL